MKTKVGVFDSGIGGLSVANAIEKALPDVEVVYREDSKNVPYGSKSPAELLRLVTPIFQSMIDDGCSVIVIACNTVTTTLIDDLRHQFSVPLVGVEPMVKPACEMTTSGVVAVCATPTTLASARYHHLKEVYARDVTILEPDCSDWSLMIEHNAVNDVTLRDRIETVINGGADVIVLACTHYHWIEDRIKDIAGTKRRLFSPSGR